MLNKNFASLLTFAKHSLCHLKNIMGAVDFESQMSKCGQLYYVNVDSITFANSKILSVYLFWAGHSTLVFLFLFF